MKSVKKSAEASLLLLARACSNGFLKEMSFWFLTWDFINSGTEISKVTLIPPTRSNPKASDRFLTSAKVEPKRG